MYIPVNVVIEALETIKDVHAFYGISYLVGKLHNLPVGRATEFSYNQLEEQYLDRFFKPDVNTAHYFRTFRTSDKKKYWLNPDYAFSGSQATRTQKFNEAYIHEKNSNYWAWSSNYVEVLERLLYNGKKLPAFHLAVWIYREFNFPTSELHSTVLENMFFRDFNISDEERSRLFEAKSRDINILLTDVPPTWQQIEKELSIPSPPDASPISGAILTYLHLKGVGPSKATEIGLAERLNLFTGDNGLGKSFILECAWWALTEHWVENPAAPNALHRQVQPIIVHKLQGSDGRESKVTSFYDFQTQSWERETKSSDSPGLVVYARVNGSCAIYDPYRIDSLSYNKYSPQVVFSRDAIWNGLSEKNRFISNGLISDWVTWQLTESSSPFKTLRRVLTRLSPPSLEQGDLGLLEPGTPTRIPGDSRQIPTLRHSYGEVPLIFASAAVQRIVALAYIIVWAWEEHKVHARQLKRRPQSNIVIMVDEVESHLHPQWQRLIVPTLVDVHRDIERGLSSQIIMTTHSPLVMASVEPIFNLELDKIFHLNLVNNTRLALGEVVLEEPDFTKYGTVDSWLMSNIFELRKARSIESEQAIVDAISLQERSRDKVTSDEVAEVNDRLTKYLPAHDTFWSRWRAFASRYGVE